MKRRKLFAEMPVISGEKVLLKQTEMKDSPHMEYMFERRLSEKYTAMMVRAFERKFKEKESLVLGIYERKTGILAGVIEAYDMQDDGSVQIGYRVSPAFQNRGYAKEAVSLFVPWLMDREDIQYLRAYADSDNKASQKILTGCGFRKQKETAEEVSYRFGREDHEE